MLGEDEDFFDPSHQVHGPTHSRNGTRLSGGPVGQIAGLRNLHGTEDAQIKMSTADHGKAVGMVEVSRPRICGDVSLARVDQLRIFLAFFWRWTHAQETVLGVVYERSSFRDELSHELRDTYAQIDVRAIGDVLGQAARHGFSIPTLHRTRRAHG